MPSSKEVQTSFSYTVEDVERALQQSDYIRMREISDYFYANSGIYRRIIWYFAGMFKFHNMVIPHFKNQITVSENRILRDFQQCLDLVDSLSIKQLLKDITFYVFKDGAYYGYLRDDFAAPVMQQLPFNYCRSRFKSKNKNVIEFNISYFDKEYRTTEDRQEVLKQFPKEFNKYYQQLKAGTLNPGKLDREWVLLDLDRAIAFKFPDGKPFFFSSIIDLIELRESKLVDIQRDKLALFLLLVQKIPMTREGEMIFDTTEARALHNNALKMLEKNDNIDVLTTFADIEVKNIQESKQMIKDNLLKAERAVFNDTGVSKMVFATEGNISLEQSIKNSEAIVEYLTEIYSTWLTYIVNLIAKPGPKWTFEVWIPPVTIFNQDKMEEKFRTQATLGYSKLLPAIVGGFKQSSILNLLKFENDILSLQDIMIPLKSTHTQSGDDDKDDGGRPPKEVEEKDDETLDNLEREE